jgi:uncharacterized protein (DUF1499 family)
MADSTNPETSSPADAKGVRATITLNRFSLALGVVCIIAGIAAGLGARFELWHFRVGFMILQWATYGLFAVILLSLIGTVFAQRMHLRAARTTGLLSLVLGLVAVSPPLYQVYLSKQVPAIHDISTDTANPPQFVAVLPLRKKDDNSLAPNPESTAMQVSAFPDLQPVLVAAAPPQTLRRAEQAARAMGWDIVAVDPQAMRIEATATTLLFGFKDDIVIRVSPQATGPGSLVDMRSASRVGRSDLGVNARRIRSYFKQFDGTA